MPLKHLEHDGNEDFGTILNRTAVKEKKRQIQELSDVQKDERLGKSQKKYLNPDNPALWNGEI